MCFETTVEISIYVAYIIVISLRSPENPSKVTGYGLDGQD
jgi:hypothetical protein